MSNQLANLRIAKKGLRRLLRQRLSEVPAHSIQSQSLAAHETLLSLPEYSSARTLSIYISMPTGEISTRSIVTDALRQGKEVYVPYISQVVTPNSEATASEMDMVGLHSQEDFEQLEPDSWGIPSPSESSIGGRKLCLGKYSNVNQKSKVWGEGMESLDMIVLPGMAFDQRFARLGHGKGYYDSFLSQYQQGLENCLSSESRMPFLGMRNQE